MNPNYRTLNNDIGMIQRTNNGWDLWFDNGDLVKAEDFHSLQVGIIIACLTSWNYMNRYGNPTYEVFGNRAYQLLKANKSSMVQYKIQQFFMECLKRMRRVYDVVSLTVSEVPYEPHKYFVEFEVISINNQLVDGSFIITTDTSKSSSYIEYITYMPYASNENDLVIDLWLKNEYGGGLEGEILYMYLKRGDDDYEFRGVVGQTDENGYLRVTYNPWDDETSETRHSDDVNIIYFDFHGNTTYNPSTSKRTSFKTELFEYFIEFTNDDIVDYRDYADLTVRLRKKSLLDDECYPLEYTTVTVFGTDGRIYEALTDPNGEATVRVKITEDTLFATSYNNSKSYMNVTILKQTPTITLTTNKTQMLMGELLELRAIVKDENNRHLKDFEIIFKDGGEIIGSATTNENGVAVLSTSSLLAKEYQITANSNNTNFYDPSESDSVTVTIDKHIPIIEVSVEEPPIVVDNDILLTALVTENESRLFNLTVSFKDEENNELGTALCSDGVATLLINGLDVGEHTITATVMENDYYVSANDSVTFTIIDHDYDVSLNVQKTSSTIENNNNILYMLNVAPIITDNGFSVNHLNMDNEPLIISCNDTGDEWTVTEYVKDETLFSTPYVANSSETVTFTVNWGEIEVTEEFVTPYWEDYCVNDSTSNYQDITFAIDSAGDWSQVVSDELCKNNWTIVDGYTVTNSSIQNNGNYEPIHYTATQPIHIELTPMVVNQWSYGEGFFVGVKRKYNDDFDYETDLEEEGYGFNISLDTGDEVWAMVDSSQQVTYKIWTISVPNATLTYDSSQQSYLLSSDDTGEINIAKAVPNVINSNNIKLSCKVKLTSDSSDNEFILGLTDSKNFETNQYDYISITGNGVVNYVRRYYRGSNLTLTTFFEENIYETFENTWVTLELEKTPFKIIGKIYDENNELITSTVQSSLMSFNYIFISTKNNTTGNYVKDIVVEPVETEDDEHMRTLYEDACSNSSGLTNYGSNVPIRGFSSRMGIGYDSTENAYKVNGANNWCAMIPIPLLNDEDNYVISADFKAQNLSGNGVGFCLDNRNDTTSYSYACWIEENGNKFVGKQFNLNSNGTVNEHTGLNLDSSKWYHMELIVNGTSLTGNLYDGDTLISTDSTTLSIMNKQVGIFLITQNGYDNSSCYVKNIKAEEIDEETSE